ncbi:hypothetical protein COCCADRAFT_109959 [Bipolaris zeicola 26-R-13]|uniref:Heterokaryon incompatibility domain-containing protein n=1 Tax=Cochliobolus carbonum (strain 26-R-13) TaxID=930089 RepID=W6XR89_COCC2|nr:uncharacterized protein COCCADRAFT_109959 [Bipolaris zeicola 26-R-13]EUC28128.1 hypothetical protein COCCADRAFT_109959 [Bipolaris zeicola 26-R-13]
MRLLYHGDDGELSVTADLVDRPDTSLRDSLQSFLVDTCCINKANKTELSLAIRSMFRWYRDAARW